MGNQISAPDLNKVQNRSWKKNLKNLNLNYRDRNDLLKEKPLFRNRESCPLCHPLLYIFFDVYNIKRPDCKKLKNISIIGFFCTWKFHKKKSASFEELFVILLI